MTEAFWLRAGDPAGRPGVHPLPRPGSTATHRRSWQVALAAERPVAPEPQAARARNTRSQPNLIPSGRPGLWCSTRHEGRNDARTRGSRRRGPWMVSLASGPWATARG